MVRKRWTATAGTLVLTLSDDARLDRDFEVDVELLAVVFTSPAGETRKVSGRFDNLRVGWVPG